MAWEVTRPVVWQDKSNRSSTSKRKCQDYVGQSPAPRLVGARCCHCSRVTLRVCLHNVHTVFVSSYPPYGNVTHQERERQKRKVFFCGLGEKSPTKGRLWQFHLSIPSLHTLPSSIVSEEYFFSSQNLTKNLTDWELWTLQEGGSMQPEYRNNTHALWHSE